MIPEMIRSNRVGVLSIAPRPPVGDEGGAEQHGAKHQQKAPDRDQFDGAAENEQQEHAQQRRERRWCIVEDNTDWCRPCTAGEGCLNFVRNGEVAGADSSNGSRPGCKRWLQTISRLADVPNESA